MDESMSQKEIRMRKKALAWFVLASFLVFSWSCYSWRQTPVQSIKPGKRQGAMISAVQTKSKERIDLNKKPAAKIKADSVVGELIVKSIFIDKSNIEDPKVLPAQTPFNLTTTDGTLYKVTYWSNVQDKILVNGYIAFSKPLSEIDFVWIWKLDAAGTLLLTLGIPLLTIGALVGHGMNHFANDWRYPITNSASR